MPANRQTRTRLPAVAIACRAMVIAGLAALTCQCAHQTTPVLHHYSQPRLGEKTFVTRDGTAFGYRKWVNDESRVRTVVVGLHGFCGAAIDYENLGKFLTTEHPGTAVYAYELRGQGSDPVRQRRGDIDDPANWRSDLLTFTSLLRKQYPRAKIVWAGESMGALIAVHTYQETTAANSCRPPCDALLLSSPVVAVRGDFPQWKKDAVLTIARMFPTARVSLETLAGGREVPMTHDTVHSEQSETNPWNIEKHTLRLLAALGQMIENMDNAATAIHVPTLVTYGGKDFFTRPEDVADFCNHIPQARTLVRLFYPEGYHLLMYDTGREKVIADMTDWITSLPR